MSSPSPGRLIFLHIPRTAGTTFVRILEREYGADCVLDLYDSTFGDEAAEHADIDDARVITGHFYFGLHALLPGPCRYVTFLRDPVERVVSHYHFVRRQPGHYLHPVASTMTLEEYVESRGAAEPNNDQTRLLAGRELATADGSWSPEMLPAAVHNLDEHFAVGLTERFDASLIAMRELLGWRRPFYVSRNVGTRPNDVLHADTRELIAAYNALDVELYRHARERFELQIARRGRSFARRVRTFSRLNALYRFAPTVVRA